jgi:uncharacterized protein
MFSDVGDLYYVPANSQVLMRREGYRDIWGLMQKFNSSSRPLFDFWQESIDMRAIHWLYELWVFYKLINMISESQPCNPCNKVNIVISDDQGVEHGSKAAFQQGQTLHYNRTFHPNWKDSFYSYSMVLRPDYFWVDPNTHRKVVLDAKFSMLITEIEVVSDSEIDGEQTSANQEGYPVREDLYKMHTYRDALVGTQAAVILYPGTKSFFMPMNNKRVNDITLDEVLAGKCERMSGSILAETFILDGIGAIQLRPL